ncbi:MAG: 3-phosphoshikimate 1-carboxyvinyltransferase [Candidatus Aminicenantes bacterium]
MKKLVRPSVIRGIVKAPASKSMLQRAIAAALLSETPVRISNVTFSNDSNAALQVIKALGAQLRIHRDEIFIRGGLRPTGEILNCGEAGLSLRMFSPIAALWHKKLTLTGEGSLLRRPVTMIEPPLKDLGVKVCTSNGFPPLTVKGPLKGGKATVDGAIGSQLLTGLLMALPKAAKDSRLIVENLKSIPYIDMTLGLLKMLGVDVRHSNYEKFFIRGMQTYRFPRNEYWVEGDWSGAAFLLAAGAVGGTVTVTGLDTESPQADRKIIQALELAGANINITKSTVEVTKNKLNAFHFDATHCPDLFPPLVALACNCEGKTVLMGVERLIHKESNRALALEKEFTALGGEIHVAGNQMEVTGKRLKGGTIDSHNDHRIAMAGAVAAINISHHVIIEGSECTAKSYPNFFEDLKSIGVSVHG